MGSPGPVAPNTLDEVAAAYLRSAADTLTARIRKDLPRRDGWLLELARRVGIPAPDGRAAVARAIEAAAAAIERAGQLGQRVVTSQDPAYPPLLTQIADPPLVLWVLGDAEQLSRSIVAVVGARAASPAGLMAAERLGHDLAAAGLVVSSGMARGIDGAAHTGALDAEGMTVAVLGSGVDRIYPPEHRGLAERIARSGAVISELPPGMPPLSHHFPLRNRIISGLSRAVVVIEASEQSGSLITAKTALEQNRDVLAVPGGIASGRYRGSHGLIKDGARLVETVGDVLDEIGWRSAKALPPVDSDKSLTLSSLEREMALGEPCSVDELVGKTGRPAGEVLVELSLLELAGRVTRAPGGGFLRVD